MKKKLMVMSTMVVLVRCLWAAITIDPIARTFAKNGGANSINTDGEGIWTATTDVDWITIKPRTTGDAGVSCVYIVAANKTADIRVGHIMINDNVHTVTQTGYDAELSPASTNVDFNMHQGSVQITLEAGIAWSATANTDWLSVHPTSGEGPGIVSYTVASYDGQVPRNGSITIAGQTFTVTQNGVEIILTSSSETVSCGANIVEVGVRALEATHWQVLPQTNWINVVDAGNGHGDDTIVVGVDENPSYYPRTGQVRIGSATFRLSQKGNGRMAASILPEMVDAAASGAYGEFTVSVVPHDAPWHAESRASWLTISEGAVGDGTGMVRYVASPNSTYAERIGRIHLKPVTQSPDPDYFAGLVWGTRSVTNSLGVTVSNSSLPGCTLLSFIDSNGQKHPGVPYQYSGATKAQLAGLDIAPKVGNDFSFAFDFCVDEINRVNRFLMIGNHSIYVDEDNRLHVDELESTWTFERANATYSVLLTQSADGMIKVFAGESGQRLSCVLTAQRESMLDFSDAVELRSFVLGYTTLPSQGYLIGGGLEKIRFWTRELSEDEAQKLSQYDWDSSDVSAAAFLHGDMFEYLPTSDKWGYFPFDENFFGINSEDLYSRNFVLSDFTLTNGWAGTSNRFGMSHKALSFEVDKKWKLTTQGSKIEDSNPNNSQYPVNWSFSFWICPSMRSVDVGGDMICHTWYYQEGYQFANGVRLTANNLIVYHRSDWNGQHESTEVFPFEMPPNEWVMVSGVVRNGRQLQWDHSMTLYVNGREIGNTDICLGNNLQKFTIGGWLGKVDDFLVCESAMTSDDIYRLYQATRAPIAVHEVRQGYIVPALTETNIVMNVDGGTTNVGLSIGSRVAWTATENANWIHITSPKSGTGPAILAFDVDANPRVEERVGTLTIADVVLTVRQKGLWAEVEADATIAEVDGGYGFVMVTTEADALWSATSHADWLTIVDGEDSQGVGTAMWVADPYTDSTHSRIGSMTVAAHKVYITQRGYELSVSTNGAEVSSTAATGQIDVYSPPGTEWSVVVTEPWITITSGSSGVGSGTVRYTVAENTTGHSRTGRIIVSGEEYLITQTSTVEVKTQIAGNGSVAGAGFYEQYAVVELIATPDDGYVFSHWSGDVNGNTNRLSVMVDAAKNVTATFIPVAAADQIATDRGGMVEGLYTRDQIHALEVGNLVLDVDAASGTARVGVQLMETSDLSDPTSWRPVGMTTGNLDVGSDGTVGLNVPATGNAKFFKVVVPEK